MSERLDDWLSDQRTEVQPKTPIGEAVAYATNHWPTLGVYLNAAECHRLGQARSPSELLAPPVTRPSGKSAAAGKTRAGSFTPAGLPREGSSRTRPCRQDRGQPF